MTGISKRFGGVQALKDVDFACHSGRIHAVLG
jgi:ABC-type sugar transport system ATPase subunit